MDVTFDHAVAPRQSQGGQNGILVSAEMPTESGKRRVLRTFAPTGPSLGVPRSQQVEERPRDSRDGRQLR